MLMLHWATFVTFGIFSYTLISLFAQLVGDKPFTSTYAAFIGGFAIIPALVLLASNPFYAVALYHGFAISRFAIPMLIAIGVITSFLYSLVFLGATFTFTKLAGLVVICAGIALLAI
jgi:uncharacterized membrane protein